MLKELTTEIIYEGADVRCCLWNIFLEQLGCSDKQLIEKMDKPDEDFNHLKFFEAIEHKLVSIEQVEGECVQVVLTN